MNIEDMTNRIKDAYVESQVAFSGNIEAAREFYSKEFDFWLSEFVEAAKGTDSP